jgi:putative polyketide hydroxylase
VLQRHASPELLSTYQPERAPVGEFTTEQAYTRYVTRTAPYLGTDGIQPVAPELNIELGYRYASSAVCHDGDPGPLHDNPRGSHARPGTRAPHVWLERDGKRLSTLDLFGRRFVLLAGPDASSWHSSALAVIDQCAVAIDLHQIGHGGLLDPAGAFLDAYGMSPRDIVLVRPDGFVAWRAKTPIGSPAALAGALAQVTHRHPITSQT